MLRSLIDFGVKLVCWANKNKIIKPKEEVVKVNIGSGLAVAQDWINIDANIHALFSKWPKPILKVLYRKSGANYWFTQKEYLHILKDHTFIHYNVEYGIPFPNNSVDYLYSSHLLEHLFKEDAEKLLKESYRVLKKGGTIRICVPDLEYAISLYKKGYKKQALELFFPTSKTGYLSRHKYMYDFDMLKQPLKKTGFTNIKRCKYKQGKTPDIDTLDNNPKQTLFVEATK